MGDGVGDPVAGAASQSEPPCLVRHPCGWRAASGGGTGEAGCAHLAHSLRELIQTRQSSQS